MRRNIFKSLSRACSMLLIYQVLFTSPALADSRLEAQRKTYDQAMSALKQGQYSRYLQLKEGLRDYPLYSYLLLEEIKRQDAPQDHEVQAFLVTQGDLPAAQAVKNKWLQRLAKEGKWELLRKHYDSASQSTELDCQLALQMWREGDATLAQKRAAELWTVGHSQPNACDPLFKRWQAAGGLTEDIAWQRLRLALLYRQDALARYLVRYLPEHKALAERFIEAATKPSRLSETARYRPGAGQPPERLTDIVTVALRRMARDDPTTAMALWPFYRDLPFPESDRLAITRDIGVRLAKRHDPQALPFMAANDPSMADDQVSEWRIRLALRTGQWRQAHDLTQAMPDSLQQQNRWRYWRARSTQLAFPDRDVADQYAALADERDFYGFIAAERSRKPYALNHRPADVEPRAHARVSQTAGIRRAREFLARGQIVNARREWYHAGRTFSREELIAQAAMARDLGWHFPAIRGISQAQHWDDLDIRFPLAYQQPITQQARARQLNPTWVYAITRQESGFMEDARSHAGAIGLMQLMPGTAKETARRFGIALSNPNDVLLPERNIALGTAYLAQLHEQFQGNRVLASAAYNAGPGRVRQWTRGIDNLSADVWIENIPFDETRQYVQSVLSYAVIYGDKLGIEQPVMDNNEHMLNFPAR